MMVHARTNRLGGTGPNETVSSGEHCGFQDPLRPQGASPYQSRMSGSSSETTQKGDPPTPLLDGLSKPFYMTGPLEIFGKHG
jgi:hypothetical protein